MSFILLFLQYNIDSKSVPIFKKAYSSDVTPGKDVTLANNDGSHCGARTKEETALVMSCTSGPIRTQSAVFTEHSVTV